jgi:hypothetical protein
MRYRLIVLLLLVLFGGCGPELSKQELGVVVFEVPKVAGTDKPYAMPQLGPPVDWGDHSRNRLLP